MFAGDIDLLRRHKIQQVSVSFLRNFLYMQATGTSENNCMFETYDCEPAVT